MVMSSKCHGFSIWVITELVCKVCFLFTQGFTHKHSHLSYRRQDVWLLWHLSGIRWRIRTNLCCCAVWGDSCHPGLFSERGIASRRKSFCQVMISWWFCLKSRSATDHAVMRCVTLRPPENSIHYSQTMACDSKKGARLCFHARTLVRESFMAI